MSRVLVIEDDDLIRANLVELLETEGFGVVAAPDGETGISLAVQELPDLVICDVAMPGIDGYEVLETSGVDPLADQSTDRFTPLDDERANLNPLRHENAYPHAYDHLAQLFDHPAAPDLCVLHSADHNWEDQGGHLGEHGSLGIVQARAPFVIAGKGVRKEGLVPRSARSGGAWSAW